MNAPSSPMSYNSQAASGTVLEWTARIHFNQHELGTSFAVCVFLCDSAEIPSNPRGWQTAPTFVGAVHAFGGRGSYVYGSPGDDATEGFVHLNHGIVKLSGLKSLDEDVVKPYLTEKLQWRVQKNNEHVDLESLEVVVIVTPLTLLPGEMFPVPGKTHQYNEITYGKPGGSRIP